MTALLLASLAHAGAVADAATALEAGKLDEAVATLDGIEGRRSGVAAYDLGTLYYRKGDWPRAIAHLRAAARLRPRDGAVHHNLALARAELGVVPPPAAAGWGFGAVVTPGELGLLGLLLTLAGSVVLVRRRGAGAALGVLGLSIGTVAALGGRDLERHPVAVVLHDDAVLRDAASVNAGERFRLAAGSELRVERDYAGFLLVEDGRGRRGWLARGAAELGW